MEKGSELYHCVVFLWKKLDEPYVFCIALALFFLLGRVESVIWFYACFVVFLFYLNLLCFCSYSLMLHSVQ